MAASRSGSASFDRGLGKDDTATAEFNAILAAGGNAFEEANRRKNRQNEPSSSATSANEGVSGPPTISSNHQSNDAVLRDLRSRMESLTLYESSIKPKHHSRPDAKYPVPVSSYTIDPTSVQEELSVTKRGLDKDPNAPLSFSAATSQRNPSSYPKFGTDTSTLLSSPQPSAHVDETGASKSPERTGNTGSKKSPFGGDLMASKYASKSYTTEPTSRLQSTVGLLEDRSRVPSMPQAKKTRNPERSIGSDNSPVRSNTPDSGKYPKHLPKSHRLADTSDQTGNQTMGKDRLEANTAFGHNLLKQDTIQSRMTAHGPTLKALAASMAKPQISEQNLTAPSRSDDAPGSSTFRDNDNMLADLVPLPGAHGGKFDRLSEAERIQLAANQRNIGGSVEASLQAQSAWVDRTTDGPFASRVRVHNPNGANEIRHKAIQDVQTEAHQGHPNSSTTQLGHSIGMDENKVGASKPDGVKANLQGPDVSTTNADKERRIVYGKVLTKSLHEKWTEHKEQKQNELKHEQIGKMAELNAALSAEGDQNMELFVKEQTASLNNKKTALIDEMTQKLAAFQEDQKAAFDKQLNSLKIEYSGIREVLAADHKAKQDDFSKTLEEEYSSMKSRLEAGIMAYINELGSKDGMTKMAERLFPGVEHGDPDDDVKV
ncbi:hypothetical protein EV356DRAFT_513683 [Viridothelium virens]|uniref:Uncharacterized protein n=1 Tax=Viridothelium virens TaxID=1048519 RepID=A0A6A6HCT5_VIRVR|nr:hypothetical protein EV356DRAFT_513683 [Viridothelium virens]